MLVFLYLAAAIARLLFDASFPDPSDRLDVVWVFWLLWFGYYWLLFFFGFGKRSDGV